MKNICLVLQYDGTNYFGWQLQNTNKVTKPPTVQASLEKALKKLFNQHVRVTASGRTDRGVHAKYQVVNFKVNSRIKINNIKKALNSYLPDDIYAKKIKLVDPEFHSRFCAESKVYRYIILNKSQKDIFFRNYNWFIKEKLDIERMKDCAVCLIGKKDFSAFVQKASSYKTCVRRIKNVKIAKRRSFIIIDIQADGFLRGMARNIVSLLTDCGLGRKNKNTISKIIKSKDRSNLGKPAAAGGLYLQRVYYQGYEI